MAFSSALRFAAWGGNNDLVVGVALGDASGDDGIFLAGFFNGSGSRFLGGGGFGETGFVGGNGLKSRADSFISDRTCQRNDRIIRTYVLVTGAIAIDKEVSSW
jgi:hypothetical protein